MESVLNIKNLKKYFKNTKAVDDISFKVKKGEILGFLGPNGAGKTTTIRCIMNFVKPTNGTIKIFGEKNTYSFEKTKEKIGFLPGEVNLYKNWTGKDLIEFVQKTNKIKKIDTNLINTFNFDPTKKVKFLSSGNLQKLGLLLALISKPQLYILDEPTTALDPLLQNKLYKILKNEVKKGKSVLFSSHNLSEVEKICDRVCIIKKGKLIATENINNLKSKRLYRIKALFENKIPDKKIFGSNARIIEIDQNKICFKITGNINPVLKILSKYNLKDLEISRGNLEEMFIDYYK